MLSLRHPRVKRDVVFFAIAALIVLADQFTKSWIRSHLALGEAWPGPGILQIIHINNSGAAFGIFQDHSLALMITSLVTAILVLFYVFYLHRHFPLLETITGRATLGLIMGGIIGNLIDRLRTGYVTDFIDFRYWPAFNIADASVTIGVILLALTLLITARKMEQ